MIPFDVQLIGGYALAQRAGSRKWRPAKARRWSPRCRFISTRSTGRGVHVVTVNDYLAARDSEWMGAVYKFLGLTVGCILHDQPPQRPPRAIQLRHHLRHQRRVRLRLPARQRHGHRARRSRSSAAITTPSWTKWTRSSIDEARTPLIISGPAVVTYDEQYAQFKPQVESHLPRAGAAVQSLPVRSRGSCSRSCIPKTARIRRTPRRWSGRSACCSSASRSASRSPRG